MMQSSKAQKLNNGYSAMPVAFLGKGENAAFRHEEKRQSASKLITLAYINKANTAFEGRKLPYSSFKDELHQSRVTVWQNLKALRKDGIIARQGQSDYIICPTFSAKSYIIIYNFLLNEELRLGGKVDKRLSSNAVILLCNIISFYLNPKNKGKYYIGGIKRCASFLNVAQSTAWYVIDELIRVGAIYRKAMTKDSAGNVIIYDGKGAHRECQTVYEVNSDILKRCAAINRDRAAKRKTAQQPKSERASRAPKKPKAKKRKQQSKSGNLEKWMRALRKLELEERYDELFSDDVVYEELRAEAKANPFDDVARQRLRAYLIEHGAPEEDLF